MHPLSICADLQSSDDSNKITFTIWDLKGGDVYETIQPSLYTDKCLYLVVWDGSEGAKSVDNLKYYVADIQVRIIIGCSTMYLRN